MSNVADGPETGRSGAEPAGPGPNVGPASHLTLHYRLSLVDGDEDVISTFGTRPATLQMGLGQLAEPLEKLLMGLPEGAHKRFELSAEEAFGPRNPELVQRISREAFQTHAGDTSGFAPGDVLDFNAPGGGRYAGVLQSLDDDGAVVDFNHPLAGQPLRFEVRILGVIE